MARTTKKSAPASVPSELLVITERNGKTELAVNALAVPTVSHAEVGAAADVVQNLCLNILAGKVDPELLASASIKGRTKRLLPKMSETDVKALVVCMKELPATLVSKWNIWCLHHKKVSRLSPQGMAKALKFDPNAEGSDKVTLRDAITAWCADAKNQAIMDAKGFPQSLYNIFAEFKCIADEEGEE